MNLRRILEEEAEKAKVAWQPARFLGCQRSVKTSQ